MILQCRICAGKGRTGQGPMDFGAPQPCPACNGAGEFDLQIPENRLTSCKFCDGRGVTAADFLFGHSQVCGSCKGLGVMERPQVTSAVSHQVSMIPTTIARPTSVDFDVAISFAEEDRAVVEPFAHELKKHVDKIFFADFAEVELWGKDLYESFDSIYRLKARYCIMFVSQHYARKVWTNHERRSAQARAVQENREYILPVRLDDTEIPGLPPTICYLAYNQVGLGGLLDATLKKLSK